MCTWHPLTVSNPENIWPNLAGCTWTPPGHGRTGWTDWSSIWRINATRPSSFWRVEAGCTTVAAATVTDLDAQVLLFATDSPSTWDDYAILFRHWQLTNLATRIREKLAIVSALTPDTGDVHNYLDGFRERSWTLFRECLYDEVSDDLSAEQFSFDLNDDDAPHDPLHITWTLGLAAGASLRDLEQTSVAVAYTRFLDRFDQRFGIRPDNQR